MKALCWYGRHDVRVEDVPDPKILNPRDAILRVTSTAICGSDLHLYDHYIPTLKAGDILGHEFMGEVVEVGPECKNLKVGDRVVVPFTISCGRCNYCQGGQTSLCDNSNPDPTVAETLYGFSPAGLFGFSHMLGGYAGGQAEYARVPFADFGAFKVPDGLSDEQVLFLSDILPTAYMAAENAEIRPGDVVAIWGAGPVGQLAAVSARVQGAGRVIVIDHYPGRLALARDGAKAETLNYEEVDVHHALKDMTGGRGPDSVIDCVGLESHGHSVDAVVDRAKAAVGLATDRPHALRQAILACKKGGSVSIPGVYGAFLDKFPLGAAFAKSLTFRMGQTHVHRYMWPLLQRIQKGEIDPTFIITDRLPLDAAAQGYATFYEQQDRCFKVVLKPGESSAPRADHVRAARPEHQPAGAAV